MCSADQDDFFIVNQQAGVIAGCFKFSQELLQLYLYEQKNSRPERVLVEVGSLA